MRLKFKNPAIWLVESIFTFGNQTWESSWEYNLWMRFLPESSHYVAWIRSKKSTHQWTIFLAKSKKPYFLRQFWAFSPVWHFPPKIRLYQLLPLRHTNFMRSFKKSLWAALEKESLSIDLPTYRQWWNHRNRFRLQVGVQLLSN